MATIIYNGKIPPRSDKNRYFPFNVSVLSNVSLEEQVCLVRTFRQPLTAFQLLSIYVNKKAFQ